jgi:predicted amidophosphoribosyltransferase
MFSPEELVSSSGVLAMEIFKQPEQMSAPICSECGSEMTWNRSFLSETGQTILSRFLCLHCGRAIETETPKMASEK